MQALYCIMALFKRFNHKAPQKFSHEKQTSLGGIQEKFSPANLSLFMVVLFQTVGTFYVIRIRRKVPLTKYRILV